jgi:hypothetical protein
MNRQDAKTARKDRDMNRQGAKAAKTDGHMNHQDRQAGQIQNSVLVLCIVFFLAAWASWRFNRC